MAGMIDSSAAHPHGMPLQSPEKRRFDTITGSPSSPLALKRQRTDSPFTQLQSSHNLATLNLLQDSDTLDGAHETQGPVLYTFQDAVSLDSVAPCRPSETEETRKELSFAIMDQETHTERLAIQEDVRSGKGTDPAYLRHLKNYEKFTELDQARRIAEDPNWKSLPSHPITVVKVAIFMEYETKRCKVIYLQTRSLSMADRCLFFAACV
jgi:hypothetical protein